jgi:hypothetical protein
LVQCCRGRKEGRRGAADAVKKRKKSYAFLSRRVVDLFSTFPLPKLWRISLEIYAPFEFFYRNDLTSFCIPIPHAFRQAITGARKVESAGSRILTSRAMQKILLWVI